MFQNNQFSILLQAGMAAIGIIPKFDFVEPECGVIVDVGVDLPSWAEGNPSIQRLQAQLQRQVAAAGVEFMRNAESHIRHEAERQSSRIIEELASLGFTSEMLLDCCEPAFAMAVLERMLTRRQQQVVAGLQERIGELERTNARLIQRATSAETAKVLAEAERNAANGYKNALLKQVDQLEGHLKLIGDRIEASDSDARCAQNRARRYYEELTAICDAAKASGNTALAARVALGKGRLRRFDRTQRQKGAPVIAAAAGSSPQGYHGPETPKTAPRGGFPV